MIRRCFDDLDIIKFEEHLNSLSTRQLLRCKDSERAMRRLYNEAGPYISREWVHAQVYEQLVERGVLDDRVLKTFEDTE